MVGLSKLVKVLVVEDDEAPIKYICIYSIMILSRYILSNLLKLVYITK